jgi:hypothetical protein
MQNKLSSIRFLEDKFIMIQWLLNRDEISKAKADALLNQFVGEAEKIHKQEIIDAFKKGEMPEWFENINAEEYYQKTYGK